MDGHLTSQYSIKLTLPSGHPTTAMFLYPHAVLACMTDLEYRLCPKNHPIPRTRENFAKDFSDGERDAMTLQPMFEVGLYCLQCDRAYGLSKLKEPDTAE